MKISAAVLVTRFLFAIATVAVFTAGLYLLRGKLNDPVIALLYLLPVVLSTFFGGLWPGIVAALGAFLVFNYFFIQPYYSFRVHHTQDLVALMIFLVVAIVTSELVGRTQASLAAATDREREAVWLYELSTALAGISDDHAITQVLAEHCRMAFRAACVQVSLEGAADRKAFVTTYPEQSRPRLDQPRWVTPLQTARGLLGEIRVWRDKQSASPTEDRLLRTYASQGALALERANLAQSERRARVLEESDRLKSALLSSVSHELRTPLATIKAAVTSLRSGDVEWQPEARQDLLAAIEEETDHLNQLVGNLLNMSRIEAGALRPQRTWNVLAEVVNSAIARLRTVLQHHYVQNEISGELPLVPVDFDLMEQVFTNLLSNSVKYSPDGTTIRLTARAQDGQTMHVQVSNQGPQVPEEHLKQIFDKFHRVTAADRVTGTGLGLSICKGIVEAHGGRIWAENLPQGFAFNFTLPLTSAGEAPRLPIDQEAG